MLLLILQMLVFGLLLTAAVGLLASWIDRKVTARVQMRAGPPVLQPFYDIAKYMVKDTCVPAGASRFFFLSAPLLGLAAVALAATILWRAALFGTQGFTGDVIVLLYLLTMPAIAVAMGAFASRNPLASIGGSREIKLVLGYELPFILAVLVPVIKSNGIRLEGFLAAPAVGSLSGVLALLVAIICMQAKLTLVPFDLPEAETELAGGAFVEYSGPPLGIYMLTRAMMLFTMPVFLVTIFCGGLDLSLGVVSALLGILKYVGLVVVIVLIRNTAPRVRIDQAVRFFWGPAAAVALLAVVLAFLGW